MRVPAPVLAEICRGVKYDAAINQLLHNPGVQVVPADALQARVGTGLQIERYGNRALLFRHGHFGPKLLGPLRKLLPNPSHVAFVANWIDHALYFAGARLLSDDQAQASRCRPSRGAVWIGVVTSRLRRG